MSIANLLTDAGYADVQVVEGTRQRMGLWRGQKAESQLLMNAKLATTQPALV